MDNLRQQVSLVSTTMCFSALSFSPPDRLLNRTKQLLDYAQQVKEEYSLMGIKVAY